MTTTFTREGAAELSRPEDEDQSKGSGDSESSEGANDAAPKSDKAPRVSRPRRSKPARPASDDGHDSPKEGDEVESALAEQDRIESERRAAEERIAQMRKENLLRLKSALGIAEDRVARLRAALGLESNGAANDPADEKPARTRRARSTSAPARRASEPKAAKAKSPKATGRLPRRSGEDIARGLDLVVQVVTKAGKDGMRAEQIRSELGMDAKEMPRILKMGLANKVLRSKGKKRATTYFVK